MRLSDAEINNTYYITCFFIDGLWRIADPLILAIVYRTIAQSSTVNMARRLYKWHRATIIILVLGLMVMYGLSAWAIWSYVTARDPVIVTPSINAFTSMIYYPVYLLAALLAGVESLVVWLHARSKVLPFPRFDI